jgi:hypothetical protein
MILSSLAAVSLCIAGWLGYGIDQSYYRANRLATGHIVAKEGLAQFSVGHITYDASAWETDNVGETVLVRYNSRNPEYNHVDGRGLDLNPPILWLAMGGILAFAARITKTGRAAKQT